ncbi:hypothetical protein AD006_11410 [Pseudonocardia sp. EC080610-09]|uniref:hypothetical protein n=1 Tax=unclassified Pseudonocardia TaxID=2619320 RepID=UPI0006CB63FA|nr:MULTISPECIES: hypothetical protein [unclassified Pseudonocardia]ALE72452.1 hypothetical protein FRP1_03750 [Pseudonocardia sp. EC080625-04]ALL75759.1 hypothetical protein AD006_11410 [Pseudonocardia sp. EC080610-09]ALL82786.1 hypothetical protein AD017_19240 [Pseudonocardia sp. EC080619-01]
MRETLTDEGTLSLTITGRTGSWLVSGVLGDEDLDLQGMDDAALADMLRALLPTRTAPTSGLETVAGSECQGAGAPVPAAPRRGRHRRAG